ncbi:MAG: phosphoglycerate kinase [Marinosulfonomonas sp.]|nr:phosphoglycerate kinase [Marinosulfonomonas sp.]
MTWKTLDDLELAGKTVLVRVDINVPLKDGRVTDATRIERIVPTLRDILAAGGKPVLLAHFGRPKGQVVAEMSLEQLVPTLQDILKVPVHFAPDCVGPLAGAAISALLPGQVLLLENTRFHPCETKNTAEFSAQLAEFGDVFVMDAFSAAHRAHASTEGIAHLLPAAAGRLMQEELSALEAALGTPERPVAAIVGGAKVSTKLDLLANLIRKVDHLVIGGGMANTFLAAQGYSVGASLAEHDLADTARKILVAAGEAGCEIILPSDIVVAMEFKANAPIRIVDAAACLDVEMILDCGPKTVATIQKTFEKCKTLIWNGPLGAFEIEPFDAATNAAASHAAALTRTGKLISVAGGGDTVAALNKTGAAADFSYISTAGGAFLEWMEGKTLPGVAALS